MPLHAKGDINSALGTQAGFNNTDVAGNPMATPISNEITDFGWEYVFHCHILSHEEMDMMRPVTVHVPRAFPTPPALTLSARDANGVTLTWTDGTPVSRSDVSHRYGSYFHPTSWTNPGTAEVGYRIDRALGANGAFTPLLVGNVPVTPLANQTSYIDSPDQTQTWRYRVTAWNAAGDSRSNIITVAPVVVMKTTTTAVTSSRNPATYGQSVTFTATVRVVAPATGIPTGSVQFLHRRRPRRGWLAVR